MVYVNVAELYDLIAQLRQSHTLHRLAATREEGVA